jgi:ABC-type Na+ efflux pump permease subunit
MSLFSFRFNDFTPITNGFIVIIGLLLFSVSAVTSLSEERARGSLDVLLTTPLSTPTILQAKWWGTFRTVPLLAALPALNLMATSVLSMVSRGSRFAAAGGVVTGTVSSDTGSAIALFLTGLITLSILAYGAAVTSVGLALATWIRRPGRAAALCTAAFVVMVVVPIVSSVLLLQKRENLWLLIGSPFLGVGATSEVVLRYASTGAESRLIKEFLGPLLLWIAIYLSVAAGLYVLTVYTFDRCLGRVRQRRPLFLESRVVEYEAAIQ